jgi:hypothetical protein
MKLKALMLALAIAGAGASFGLTDSGRSDTGTTTTTTATTTSTSTTTTTASTTSAGDCRHFELHGTLASVAASSFSVSVKRGSHSAQAAVGTAVTVAVSASTRVSWSGSGTLTGPNVGDSVKVNGKLCGSTYTAWKVQARGPRADKGEHSGDSGKTTTTDTTKGVQHGHSGAEHGKSHH